MKCGHCSTRVERNEWFCPNCKRSLPLTRRTRSGAVRAGTFVGLLAATLAATLLMLSPGCQSRQPASNSVGTPPVTVTPRDSGAGTSEPTGGQAAVEPSGSNTGAPAKPALPLLPTGVLPSQAAKSKPIQPLVPRPGVGTGSVTVLTQPAVKTFVYLNGGSLLGETPLRNAAVPAGKHTLVFWAPEMGGRSRRPIEVVAGESQVVIENLSGKHSFAEPKEETEKSSL